MRSFQTVYEFLLKVYAEYTREELPLRSVRVEMFLGFLGAAGPSSDWVPVAQGVFTWLLFKRIEQIRIEALVRIVERFEYSNR